MKLRLAKKIMFGPRLDHYNSNQKDRAFLRWNRTHEAKEADRLWDEVAPKLRIQMGLGPLTYEEASRALDEAPPEPLSDERIQEMVDYAIRGGREK